MQSIEEENVEFIRLTFFDVFGHQKNIALMSGELERAVRWGVSIDGSQSMDLTRMCAATCF